MRKLLLLLPAAAAAALAFVPAASASCVTNASGATYCVEPVYGTATPSQVADIRTLSGQLLIQRCAVAQDETVCAWSVDTGVLRDNFFVAVFLTVAAAWFVLRTVWFMLRLFGIVNR